MSDILGNFVDKNTFFTEKFIFKSVWINFLKSHESYFFKTSFKTVKRWRGCKRKVLIASRNLNKSCNYLESFTCEYITTEQWKLKNLSLIVHPLKLTVNLQNEKHDSVPPNRLIFKLPSMTLEKRCKRFYLFIQLI